MKKTLELAWGVIRRPAPTFRKIKEEKPWGRGLIIFLLAIILVNSSVFFLPPVLTTSFQYGEQFLPIVGSPKVERIVEFIGGIIIDGIFIILLALFVTAVAWLFKNREKDSIKNLIISFLFMNALYFIWIPFLYGISFLERKFELGIIISGLIVAWSLALLSVAIGEVFSRPVFKRKWRRIVFVSSLAILVLVFIGLAGWSYYFEKDLIRNIKNDPRDTQSHTSRIILMTFYLKKYQPDRVITLAEEEIEQENMLFEYLLKKIQSNSELSSQEKKERIKKLSISKQKGVLAACKLMMGTAYLQKQDYPKAEEELCQYLAWNSKHAHVYNLLGLVYYRQGKYEETINCLQEVLKLEPKNREYRRNLEKAKARLNKSKLKWFLL